MATNREPYGRKSGASGGGRFAAVLSVPQQQCGDNCLGSIQLAPEYRVVQDTEMLPPPEPCLLRPFTPDRQYRFGDDGTGEFLGRDRAVLAFGAIGVTEAFDRFPSAPSGADRLPSGPAGRPGSGCWWRK